MVQLYLTLIFEFTAFGNVTHVSALSCNSLLLLFVWDYKILIMLHYGGSLKFACNITSWLVLSWYITMGKYYMTNFNIFLVIILSLKFFNSWSFKIFSFRHLVLLRHPSEIYLPLRLGILVTWMPWVCLLRTRANQCKVLLSKFVMAVLSVSICFQVFSLSRCLLPESRYMQLHYNWLYSFISLIFWYINLTYWCPLCDPKHLPFSCLN